MNKKYFVAIMLFTIGLFFVLSGIAGAEEAAVAIDKQPIEMEPSGGNITGNGYIALEAKNVDALYEQVKSIITKHQALVKNFSLNNSPDMKYKNLTLEVTLDIAAAPSFMNELSGLKAVKNQSYNQYAQPEINIPALQQELGTYNDRLNKVLSASKADVEVVKLLVNKITETENRIKSLEMNQPMFSKARINITIMQKGYPANYDQRQKKDLSIILTVIIAGMALVFFVLGLFSIKLITRFKKKKIEGEN